MGIRPTVRGSVMNPNDHPHGGGEGKAPVSVVRDHVHLGANLLLAYKTRKKNKQSNKMIIRRRDGKALSKIIAESP